MRWESCRNSSRSPSTEPFNMISDDRDRARNIRCGCKSFSYTESWVSIFFKENNTWIRNSDFGLTPHWLQLWKQQAGKPHRFPRASIFSESEIYHCIKPRYYCRHEEGVNDVMLQEKQCCYIQWMERIRPTLVGRQVLWFSLCNKVTMQQNTKQNKTPNLAKLSLRAIGSDKFAVIFRNDIK